MFLGPPESTRTDPLLPYTTLFRSGVFVDRRESRVAQILRGAGLLDIAHPAMHRHAEAGDEAADIGRVRLGERGEQFEPPARRRIAKGGMIDLRGDRKSTRLNSSH